MGSSDEVVGNVSVFPEGCYRRFIKDFLGGGLRLKSFVVFEDDVPDWDVSGMICKKSGQKVALF